MGSHILDLPVIQSVGGYLTMTEMACFGSTCKAVYTAAKAGQIKLEQPLFYKHTMEEDKIKFISQFGGKTLKIYDPKNGYSTPSVGFIRTVLRYSPHVENLSITIDVGLPTIYPKTLTIANNYGELRILNPQSYAYVTKLRILTAELDTNSFVAFLASPYAKQLVKLKMNYKLVNKQIIDEIVKLPCLEKLSFVNAPYPITVSEFAEYLGVAFAKMHNLRKLCLRNCKLSSADITGILNAFNRTLDKPSSIKHFKLDGNIIGYDYNETFNVLPKCMPSLQMLNLANNCMDSSICRHLGSIIYQLPHLKHLTLGANSLCSGIKYIIDALPSTIEQFYMHGCSDSIVDNEVIRLALSSNLSRMHNLWGLGLNGNYLTDHDVLCILNVLPPSIRDIGITNVSLTNEFMEEIARTLTSRCPKLRYVYLYNIGYKSATSVSFDGLNKFYKALTAKTGILVSNFAISKYVKHH